MNTKSTDIQIELQAAMRLQTWLSPAFPTGAYAYSHGLETVIADGQITSGDELYNWITPLLKFGSGKSDAIIFKETWHAASAKNHEKLQDLNKLALALQPSAERYEETTAQAAAFLNAIDQWPNNTANKFFSIKMHFSLPVVIATHCANENIDLSHCLSAYLNAYTANLIWIAVRLIPLGQSDGLKVIARLEKPIVSLCKFACLHSIDAIGTSMMAFDIASQNHEYLETRIFKS